MQENLDLDLVGEKGGRTFITSRELGLWLAQSVKYLLEKYKFRLIGHPYLG